MGKKKYIKYYLALSVSLLTFIVYLSSLRNEFVLWDDDLNVINNTHIRSFNFAFFRWAFLDFTAPGSDYWRPLSYMSHALDYAIWGLNPIGHHLTNNILHALNTFIVVLLVARLMEAASILNHHRFPLGLRGERLESFREGVIPPGYVRFALFAAAATGLLFGLHPLQVESVAWVSERKNLLYALFFLISILMYTRYVVIVKNDTGHKQKAIPLFNKHYFLITVFFVLSLLSKPMAVTLPLVLLLLDWYPFRKIKSLKTLGNAILEKLPLILLSLFSSILTVLALKSRVMASMETVPLSSRLLVGARSLTAYLWKMALPQDLVPFYPYPKSVSFLSFEYLLPVVIVILITIICIGNAKKYKLGLSVWGYYVITLIPVLGILQVGGQSMADRYAYLPSLGPFVLMGLGAAWVWEKLNTLKNRRLAVKFAYIAVVFFTFAIMSYMTLKQVGIWKNSIIFWSYVIEKEPAKVPVAYSNRCACFSEMGEFDKAILDCDMAIAVRPTYDLAYNNRGNVFLKMGIYDRAMADFDKAIALNPSFSNAYNNRGNAFGRIGQFEEAIANYDRAIALDPSFQLVYYNRGLMYLKTHKKELAISDFQKACDSGLEIGCKASHDISGMFTD